MRVTTKTTALLAVVFFIASCGGGGSSVQTQAPPLTGCSVAEQNQFIIDLMRDIYYWLEELPVTISAADYTSPEATLEAMVFADIDRFSGIRNAEENDAFFSDSQFIGIGITLSFKGDDRVFIAQVFSDGPAAAAGLERGYEILEINNQTIAAILAAGNSVSDAFGADEIGVNVNMRYRDLSGSDIDVSFAKALVTIETVSQAHVVEANGNPVGYLHFRNFVEPSFDALREAFAMFAQANVTDVVLDLRYNGGGLISVAEFLSSLLGGSVTDGQLFSRRVHNSMQSALNVDTFFSLEINALNLTRLVVITTGSSASASELVINGLRPFLDVKLVGEPTFGKPVGAYQYDFCDKVAVPIAFANLNALNVGDYFDGLAVDCAASDDLSQPLGNVQEGMLAEALHLLSTGSCSAVAVAADAAQKAFYATHSKRRRQATEFGQLINAY